MHSSGNQSVMSEPGIREVRLTIPAKPEYITLCRLALTGISRLRPLGDETLADLKLALTEACSNSVRHAYDNGDGSVDIRYELHSDRLVIEVSDDGAGFDPARVNGGYGLRGMRTRVAEAGGTLTVRSAPGAGTQVSATVPA